MKVYAVVDTDLVNEYEDMVIFLQKKDAQEFRDDMSRKNKNPFEVRELEVIE